MADVATVTTNTNILEALQFKQHAVTTTSSVPASATDATSMSLVLQSMVQNKFVTIINVEVPSGKNNPFLQTSKFRQGTLYAIIFPIIGFILLVYILGVFINKIKANKEAKKVESFDREYEFANGEFDDNDNYSDVDDPFSDVYDKGNRSFLNIDNFEKKHRKGGSSIDFLSQYRRSMDNLSGISEHYTEEGKSTLPRSTDNSTIFNKQHKAKQMNTSIGSILQLNLPPSQQSNISENTNNSSTNASQQQFFYSVLNTPVATQNNEINSNNNKESESSSYYSIDEPTKSVHPLSTKLQIHSHKRSLSSMALDNFITTGNLPVLQNKNHESTSIFENGNVSYTELNDSFNDLNNDTTIPNGNEISRTSSPQRSFRVYHQRDSSKSPVRNSVRSPTRSPVRSPTRSPIRSPIRNHIRGNE